MGEGRVVVQGSQCRGVALESYQADHLVMYYWIYSRECRSEKVGGFNEQVCSL